MSGFSEIDSETLSPEAALPPIGDVMHDLNSPITVASLVNNEYNFTDSAAHEDSPRLLGMPWYLFVLTVVTSVIIVGWLSGVCKSVHRRVKLAWTTDLGDVNQAGSMERIPTEVSSARLLRAVRSEVDMAEVTEYESHRGRLSEFTTVDLKTP